MQRKLNDRSPPITTGKRRAEVARTLAAMAIWLMRTVSGRRHLSLNSPL